MATYDFAIFDSRGNQGAQKTNEGIFRDAGTDGVFGVGIADPELRNRCVLGNIIPRRLQPTAIEMALEVDLPPDNARIVTDTPNVNTLGAMAILRMRGNGWDFVNPVPDSNYPENLMAQAGEQRRLAALTRINTIAHAPGQIPGLTSIVEDTDVHVTERINAIEFWIMTGQDRSALI